MVRSNPLSIISFPKPGRRRKSGQENQTTYTNIPFKMHCLFPWPMPLALTEDKVVSQDLDQLSFLLGLFLQPLNSRSVYLSMPYLLPLSGEVETATMDQVQMQLFLYLSTGINIISVMFFVPLFCCLAVGVKLHVACPLCCGH